jgi:hypothetical protein
MKKINPTESSRQSKAILEETRQIMAERRKFGRKIIDDLRTYKITRQFRRVA